MSEQATRPFGFSTTKHFWYDMFRVIDRNFATVAMLLALICLLGTVLVLVSLCGVKAESPVVNTLATSAVGIGGAIAGLSIPAKDREPKP